MNPVIEQLLRSQLESVEYRITITQHNIDTVSAQLDVHEADLAILVDEADALRAALPTPAPEAPAEEGQA